MDVVNVCLIIFTASIIPVSIILYKILQAMQASFEIEAGIVNDFKTWLDEVEKYESGPISKSTLQAVQWELHRMIEERRNKIIP